MTPSSAFTHGPTSPRPFRTVTEAFLHAATNNPDLVAARHISPDASPAREITYGSLLHHAKALSMRLRRDVGVQPGDRVPVIVKRGIPMLVGIFAVLLAGAQYVPLDAGVVAEKTLAVVLEQSRGTVLCVRGATKKVKGKARLLILEDEMEKTMQEEGSLQGFQDLATEDGGCYVIYTSGTTGPPKGVDVLHKNVANLLTLEPGNLGIKPGVTVGQVLAISFDMAAWEMLGCLCNGGTLVVRSALDKSVLSEIQVLICTPSILRTRVGSPSQYPNIRVVANAGEPSDQRLADTWSEHGTYYNCCGPTETTIVNTMQKHETGQSLSIGRPTPNNTVYILDRDTGRPVDIGEEGLMWAGGLAVTNGYIGLPEKTAERYKPDCFANDGSMMFNTGDLGRWMENGQIEVLGRLDDQVKINGFRVELDGVSASIASFPEVSSAVAILVRPNEMHAFISPSTVDIAALKKHMEAQQPYYSRPRQYHQLETLPATANGKIDKKHLKSSVLAQTTLLLSAPGPIYASDSAAESALSLPEKQGVDLEAAIPDKVQPQPVRGLVHRVFIVYRRLFTIVTALNLIGLAAMFAYSVDRQWLTTMTAINLTVAVLVRQDFVINLLYKITCSVPRWFPLAVRKRCAKIYHLGGVHSSAAIFAGLWLLASEVSAVACQFGKARGGTCAAGFSEQSTGSIVVSWVLIVLFGVMIVIAYPSVRKRHHNVFERTHRFVGWTMLALFWAQTVVGANDARGQTPLGTAVAQTPGFWLLLVATLSIATSWVFLRQVPVEAEVLSNHAVRLHFSHTVPTNGTFSRLSLAPLLEWHSFATIPTPAPSKFAPDISFLPTISTPSGSFPTKPPVSRPPGFSLVVSNAGDWTRSLIDNPPSRIYTRGVPTSGVMRIATLFNSVLLVATGSGIGPLLGHISSDEALSRCNTRLIWSTKDPENTFGGEICAEIREKVRGALIHDTDVSGRPDLVKMAWNMAKAEGGVEAVIVIANEKITKKIVYGLETRGLPAYGAIWDS